MTSRPCGVNRLVMLFLAVALLLGALPPPRPASAAGDTVLFHLDGASGAYIDRTGAGSLAGAPAYSSLGRAFGARQLLTPAPDPRLGAFPYGAFGITGTDTNGDGDHTDAGEVDPVRLMDAMAADGVYNLALSVSIGRQPGEKELKRASRVEIVRILRAARDRNLRVVIRLTELVENNGVFTMDTAATDEYIRRFKLIFNQNPELRPVVYAWYSYDEPMQRNMTLAEMRRIYQAHKATFPDIPVLTVFNQNRVFPDGNYDGISDGMLGQPENPYGAGVTDIVALDVYPATPNYQYGEVRDKYAHARRVVSRVSPSTPVWAVPQGHGKLVADPSNVPEPHHLYRQANDWFRAGPDTGLRAVDGLLWYSWHFPPGSAQSRSDLEDNPANRRMAKLIGERIRAGRMVTHRLPYRRELYVPSSPASALTAPRAGHLELAAGTLTLALSHPWPGNDGVRHVLLDTGASATRDRLLLEKTADNVLRLAVIDASGNEKWAGVRVDALNMPGASHAPGYSDIAATWSNGSLALYLDGVRGGLGGGVGAGRLSSGGAHIYLGTDLAGRDGANGAFGYVTIRSGAGTASEVSAWTTDSHLAHPPTAPALSSPAAGASTTDRTPSFAWAGVSGAVRYEVQLSTSPDFATLARGAAVTGAAYTIPAALEGGRTYHWRVRALDNYGAGPWSPSRSLLVR